METCKKNLSIQSFVHPCALQLYNWDLFIWKYSMLAVGRIDPKSPQEAPTEPCQRCTCAGTVRHQRRGTTASCEAGCCSTWRGLGGCSCGGSQGSPNNKQSTGKDFQLNFPHVFWFRSVDDWMFQRIDSTFCFRDRKLTDPVKLCKKYPEGPR